jgi:hypothetical protein
MKRHTLRMLVLALVTVALSMPAAAGWKYVNFNMYSEGGNPPLGTVDYNVHFWLNWERYQSHFTMYKVAGSMRIYVTVFGASYEAFKQQTSEWDSDDQDGRPNPGDPAAGIGSPGAINWTDDTLVDNDGNINFVIWCPDFFRDVYGHPLRVSVFVAPHPGRRYGPNPDVNVTVNNGVLESVKVVYPRQPTRGGDEQVDIVDDLGRVSAQCGYPEFSIEDFNNRAIGWIGVIHVGGGILGSSSEDTTGWQGLLHLISRARRHKKIGLLQGGTMDQLIATGGRMTRIYTDNGLGAPVAPGMPDATAPEIGAGWRLEYDDNGPDHATPFGVSRVVMKRGGLNARVTAGSDPTASTPADWAFQGQIKKIVCKDKGGGANTGVNDCTFVTLGVPKKTGTAAIVNSWVETPNASIDLNTL